MPPPMLPLPTADQIALIVALGALAGGAPSAVRFGAMVAFGLAAGAAFGLLGLEMPWWSGPVWALALGVLVYAGVPLARRAGLSIAVAGGLVAGMVLVPGESAAAAGATVAAALAALCLSAVLARGATRRGGAWSCQVPRLVGGLAAFAGAAALLMGGFA